MLFFSVTICPGLFTDFISDGGVFEPLSSERHHVGGGGSGGKREGPRFKPRHDKLPVHY